ELHAKAQPVRDHPAEQHDSNPDQQDRDRVSDSPYDADRRRTPRSSVAADDGRYGDDVIGIGGVPHPEEEPQRQDRKQTGHETAIPRCSANRESSNAMNSGIPSPVLAATRTVSIPGRTAWMLAAAASQSNSTAPARSVLVITATSALLKMGGYLSGLSSPSVTDISTSRRFSPRSYEAGQTRLPTFSTKRK